MRDLSPPPAGWWPDYGPTKGGGGEGVENSRQQQRCRFSAAALQQDIISAWAAAILSKAKLSTGKQEAALLVLHNGAYSRATYHAISSGAAAQAKPAAAYSRAT